MFKTHRLSLKRVLATAALFAGSVSLGMAQSPSKISVDTLAPVPPIPIVIPEGHVTDTTQSRHFDNDPNAIRVLLSAQIETILSAQMFGKIDEFNAGLGQGIQEGEVLLTFSCEETKARLKMAQAEVASARETLKVKQRLQRLNAAGESEVLLAQLDLDKSLAAIEIADAQLQTCVVKAPFEGHVVKLFVKPHQTVNAGAPLLEVISHGPLKLRMNLPSRLLRSMTVGSVFDVDILETDRTYEARVSRINSRIDAIAQTVEIEALIEVPDHELTPGMSGVAHLRTQP